MLSFGDSIVVCFFLLVVLAMFVVHAWLAYRMNRSVSKENARLLQCNLALSEKPLAFPMAQLAEETIRAEVASERDQGLASNGHAPAPARPSRMQA